MVSQLKPGMSREQVRFVLGTPLVSDIFHADQAGIMSTAFSRARVPSGASP